MKVTKEIQHLIYT